MWNRVKEELDKKAAEKPKPPASKYRIYKRPEDDKVVIDFGNESEWVVSKRAWAFLDHLITRLTTTGFISHEIFMQQICQTVDDHGVEIRFKDMKSE